jgi:hypothetical protein
VHHGLVQCTTVQLKFWQTLSYLLQVDLVILEGIPMTSTNISSDFPTCLSHGFLVVLNSRTHILIFFLKLAPIV